MNYLFYGIDPFLLEEAIKKVIKTEEEVLRFDMNFVDMEAILEEANMYSMFSSKKVLILQHVTGELFQNETLLEYVKYPNPLTTLIFLWECEKLDTKKKIAKEVVAYLKVMECKKMTGLALNDYVKKLFLEDGFSIDSLAIRIFLSRVGENMNLIVQEIEKLKTYKIQEKVITKEDIDMLTSKNMEDNIFELIHMAVSKNKNGLFEIYHDLILKGEEPIKIIVSLANQLRILYQVKYYAFEKKMSEEAIAKVLGIHPYRVKLAKEKAYGFQAKELKHYLLALARLDLQIKKGMVDKCVGLELFLLSM